MFKGLLLSAAIAATGLFAVPAQAQTFQEGRSAFIHHRGHTATRMMYGAPHRGVSYGVGSRNPRTTATGGNSGGYTTRN